MNETRNIIAGLEIGKTTVSDLLFTHREKEPISVSVKAGSNQYLFPTSYPKSRGKKFGILAWKLSIFPRMKEKFPLPDFWGCFGNKKKSLWIDNRRENQKSFWNVS